MDNSQVLFRDHTSSDTPFILNSYLKSYREAPINRMLTDSAFYKLHVQTVNELIKSPLSHITVAVDPEHQDQIYGYVWYFRKGGEVYVNWLYVKLPFRKFGLAKALVAKVIGNGEETTAVHYTHFNDNFKYFKSYGALYSPWYYFLKETAK